MKFPANIQVFGDKSFRGPCPLEGTDQKTLIHEIRHRWPRGIGRLVIHPRNEGKRSKRKYQREFLDGLTAGAPDIIIPGCPTLCLELKRRDHTLSSVSLAESEYLEAARRAGCYTAIALGWEAGLAAVEAWRYMRAWPFPSW